MEPYWLGVYLMHRVGNLSLEDVAGRVGATAARISQIQMKIEHVMMSWKITSVLKHYKLKG